MAKISLPKDLRLIVVNVLLKGKKDSKVIKMVLDTGASLTTFPAEIALAIGLDPSLPKRRIEMITASGVEYAPVVTVPEIDFLGYKIKNVEMACLNLPPQSAVSGLLGLNVLKNFDVLLKFRSKSLEITK